AVIIISYTSSVKRWLMRKRQKPRCRNRKSFGGTSSIVNALNSVYSLSSRVCETEQRKKRPMPRWFGGDGLARHRLALLLLVLVHINFSSENSLAVDRNAPPPRPSPPVLPAADKFREVAFPPVPVRPSRGYQ